MNRLLLAAAAIALVLAPLPAQLPTAPAPRPITDRDAFFRSGTVLNLKLEFDKKNADTLRQNHRTYVKVRLKDGKDAFEDVGVHLKGAAGSFRGLDDKPGLTLNLDKFKDGQRWRGMDKFHLANSVQDPSYLTELICGELFRAAGVPSARIGHALVTIDGRKRGLYYVKEGYDREFLKSNFENPDGNFYDGGFLRDIDQPLELVSTKKDVADRKDLQALVKAAREGDPKKRFEKLEKLLEMERFISYMVIEAIAWDWDGYPFKCNNYRVYHDPVKDKITFIPSGMDQMFWEPYGPALPGFGGMVAAAIVNSPEGQKRYYARMREILKDVYKPEQIVKRLDELEKIIQPALASVDAGAGNDYKNQINRLRVAVRERAKNLEQQLKNVPR